MDESTAVPPLWWSPSKGVIQRFGNGTRVYYQARGRVAGALPADAMRLVTPSRSGDRMSESTIPRDEIKKAIGVLREYSQYVDDLSGETQQAITIVTTELEETLNDQDDQ
jgi:hypothetical protein